VSLYDDIKTNKNRKSGNRGEFHYKELPLVLRGVDRAEQQPGVINKKERAAWPKAFLKCNPRCSFYSACVFLAKLLRLMVSDIKSSIFFALMEIARQNSEIGRSAATTAALRDDAVYKHSKFMQLVRENPLSDRRIVH
jgi:hypothetical protein